MINEPMLGTTPRVQGVTGIADLLDFRSSSHGQKEALICDSERVTYNELITRAKSVARQLHSLSIRKGDKVALYMPNSVDYVASFFGALGLGCTVVPVNPLLKPDEIAHILSDSDARAIIAQDSLIIGAAGAIRASSELRAIIVVPAFGEDIIRKPEFDVPAVELERNKGSVPAPWPCSVDPEKDLAAIVYTSGTTGKPKGAMLTHYNLLSVFPARLDVLDVSEHDVCLGTLPLCHIYGMAVVMIGTVARGATLVIMRKFDARQALDLIQNERVTLLPAVPAMYQFMLHELGQTPVDLSSLRVCFSGGAPLSAGAISRIESAFGVPVCEGYALTETACVATINPLRGPRKVGSVGPQIPGAHVRVIGQDGQWMPPGSDNVGEILVWGPNVMLGYYKQPQATAEILRNGWFFTGDLGYVDADGYIYIVGRKKELIIRGGANIYPREIEDVIVRLPGVRECAVIGVPDELMGERVKAFVATSQPLSDASVRDHCAKYLADYKVPRIVEFVDALPRNSTGKILKRLLK